MAHFLVLVLVDRNHPDGLAVADAHMRRYFASDMQDKPEAKCDGFVIGGRFDGDIWDKPQAYDLSPADYEARYGLDKIRVEDNIRLVGELRDELVPFAVITPDGTWRDADGKSEQDWEAEWRTLRSAYQSHLAVAFDCHC